MANQERQDALVVKPVTKLHVHAISNRANKGVLSLGNMRFPCLLGKNGRTTRKREGDGKSPEGSWLITEIYSRHDRLQGPKSAKQLKPSDGWCDAPESNRYNRKVKLPFKASHERLWRDDEAYDILGITNHNQHPRIKGAGSAIFLHLWRDGANFTEGCIALRRRDMLVLLSKVKGKVYLVI